MANRSDSETADENSHAVHGRRADAPWQIPPKGWMQVFTRVFRNLKVDNLPIVAAGVAFYAFLAFVPALAAVIAIYAFVADPGQAQEHVRMLSTVLPTEAVTLLEEQIGRMASDDQGSGWGAILAIVVALWGSARGVKGLMKGLNVAYHEREDRNILVLNALALLLTLGAIVMSIVLFALVAVLPGVLEFVGLGGFAALLVQVARWGLLVVLFLGLLAAVYRFGPSRESAKWRWLSPGAVFSTILWLIASVGFSIYVRSFGNFDATYGALGAVVVFMLWLFLSAFVVLLGAEVNSELERQTKNDSTTEPDRPMGDRGAYSADTLA